MFPSANYYLIFIDYKQLSGSITARTTQHCKNLQFRIVCLDRSIFSDLNSICAVFYLAVAYCNQLH